MRDVTKENITDAVLETIGKTENARLKLVLSSMVRHLHDLVREVDLTHEEWIAAIDYLFRAGKISTPVRNEFILTSDVLGVSSLVDIVNDHTGPDGTETSVLGPFYQDGSPEVEVGGDMIGENAGEPGVFFGRVLAPGGRPIPGATIDVWQTAAHGLYQAVDAGQPPGNMRARQRADEEGNYCFTTIKPVSYQVPEDGPAGDMMAAIGKHAWRPAHVHFIVSAAGHRTLTTSLYVQEDPYIDQDAVFGVRDSLVVSFKPNDSAEEAARFNLKPPFWKVEYDFGLSLGQE